MAIKLETQSIRSIATFEQLTNVHAKDCLITDDCIYFLVEPGKVGLAVGKNGSVVKRVERILGKPIKIFEFADEPEALIKNIIPHVKSIEINDRYVMVSIPTSDRSVVIGKGGGNIKAIKEFLYRHFKIKNLRLR